MREFVRRFYLDIAQDARFSHYFEDLAGVDWHAHTRDLTDFWVGLLLTEPDRDPDMMIEKHRWLHDATPFGAALFDRWLEILETTVDDGWTGPVAERAKRRGLGLAWAMARRFLGEGAWTHPSTRR